MPDPIDRVAGRAIVLAATGRVLMIRGEDPGDRQRGGFWFTPGGGLDPGETVEDGTMRELHEELGLEVDALGPVVMRRLSEFPIDGLHYRQTETFFLACVEEEFEPAPVALEPLEASVITEFRWLSAQELRGVGEDYYPTTLAELIEELTVRLAAGGDYDEIGWGLELGGW